MTECKEKGSAASPRVSGTLRIDQALAAGAMAIICLISMANVIVRYVTDISFAFTEEFSVFLLVFMTLIGTALAFATKGHLRITFFVDRLPRSLRRGAEAVSLLATVTVFSLVCYYGALFAYDQWEFEETSAGLGYPSWIYSIWLPILGAAILYRAIESTLKDWRAKNGEVNDV